MADIGSYDVSDDTRSLIDETVHRHLAGYNVEPCKVTAIPDDNDSVGLAIGIHYRSAGKPLSPRTTLAMLTDLRDKLVRNGDYRMPFVEHYFAVDQEIDGVRRARRTA